MADHIQLDAEAQVQDLGLPSRSQLAMFLERLQRHDELEGLLEVTVLVNPSDLLAIAECEKRMKRHTYDRTVCLSVFMADLCSEARSRCELLSTADLISECALSVVRATAAYYEPTNRDTETIIHALKSFAGCEALDEIHASFQSRFRDWRNMVRAVRRIPESRVLHESPQYGELTMGVLVADSVGNMLSHVRHMYCDRAFDGHRFCLE